MVPAGAMNIRIQEKSQSTNYLAVRNLTGHYYLNGHFTLNFPGNYEFAGCRFNYDRTPQALPAPDKITCLGPTEEPLFIVVCIFL